MVQKKRLKVAELHVEDIMTSQVKVVTPGMLIRDVVELFMLNGISGAPVVDQTDQVISVISQSDLIQFIAMGGMSKRVSSFLIKLPAPDDIVHVRRSDSFKEVFKQFLLKPVRRILVTDDQGHLQGIISKSNLLWAFMVTEGYIQGKPRRE